MEILKNSNEPAPWEDVYHGLVQKCVTTPGTGKPVSKNAVVKLALTMYVERTVTRFEPDKMNPERRYEHSKSSPFVKPLVEIMPIGLQRAVSTMCSGEEALIWIDPLMAYGSTGFIYGDHPTNESVPPHAALLIEVCVVSWDENDLHYAFGQFKGLRFEAMPHIDDRLVQTKNDVADGKYIVGLKSLRPAIKMLDHMRIDGNKEPEKDKTRRNALLSALVLASECALAVGWYPLAVTFGRRVLEITPFDASANYLLGRAYFALGYTSSAKRFVQQAWCHDVLNVKYKQKLEDIRRYMELVDETADEDGDDALSDYEILAELIAAKRSNPNERKSLVKKMNKVLQKSIENMTGKTLVLKGGFSEEFMDEVENLMNKRSRGFVVIRTGPTSLQLDKV